MTNTKIESTLSASAATAAQLAETTDRSRARRFTRMGALTAATGLVFALGACGGDDEPTATTTAPATTADSVITDPTTTIAQAATTTAAPATTVPVLVTAGATVVVANASRVDGGAGRLSERLELATYVMGEPADSTEGPLEVSKVYYNASVPEALPVAESVRNSLGGAPIELLELPTPPPVASGDIGDATVLVAMGNDIADIPLDVLQGVATTTTVGSDTDDTTDTDDTDDSATTVAEDTATTASG